MAQTFNPKKTLEYELEVGDYLLLNKEKFGLWINYSRLFQISYAGMPSKEVFSIVHSRGG